MIRGLFPRKSPTYPRGLLGLAELRCPADFVRIAAARVEDAKKIMAEWRHTPRTPQQDIETLDGVSNSLCGIADAAEFIRNVDRKSVV